MWSSVLLCELGGGHWKGGSGRGEWGGGRSGRVGWGGGVHVGRFEVVGGGVPGGAIWGVGGEGGHKLPLPPLALPLTIPSP